MRQDIIFNLNLLIDENNWETNQVFTDKGTYFSTVWINDIFDPRDLAKEILEEIKKEEKIK